MIDGGTVRGQVWALCEQPDYVWVALDGGRFVALNTRGGQAFTSPTSPDEIGRVAA